MWHDIDPKLIESVSRYPRLYDKSIGSISTLSRRDAWMAVAQECDKPMDQCQARWKSLRDRYVREINKSRTTGSVSSSFALFDNLSFLREHIQLRRKCASNASDQPAPCYYIDDITQDGPPSSMIVEQEQEQEQEYLSDNADTSSVEFIAEESAVGNECSSEHTHAPLSTNSPPEPANENQSPFFRVISLLEQALSGKSAPAEPQDPFYKYLESVLSRVDESTRGDIQLRLLNLAHEEISKARKH